LIMQSKYNYHYRTVYCILLLERSQTHFCSSIKPTIHPSIPTAPSGPWPPSDDASILLCLLIVCSILVFLGFAMCPSGRCPLILFLVFTPVFCCEIFHEEPSCYPFILQNQTAGEIIVVYSDCIKVIVCECYSRWRLLSLAPYEESLSGSFAESRSVTLQTPY
jgi:hypothetical protein